MSFLKINDPVKRDSIVKEYLELKKNIRDNQLSERAGEQQVLSNGPTNQETTLVMLCVLRDACIGINNKCT